MRKNQTEFEIARDIVTLLRQMELGEVVMIHISKDKTVKVFEWSTDYHTQPNGPAEVAIGMRKAYFKAFK